jgi:antitoxin component YwqK of YwqJK toxin-antitoxin module
MKHPFLILISSLLLGVSCQQSATETVEIRDDEGRLERFQRNKKDHKKEGLFQKWSADGKLLEEAQYFRDTLEGPRKYFYANGAVESIETYKNGKYHGKYLKFYENGTPCIDQDFVAGAMEGWSIRYYPNGAVEERVTMKNNEENGPFQEYYENGNLKTVGTYAPFGEESALEQGVLQEYDEDGQTVRIADCLNGRCVTRWKK